MSCLLGVLLLTAVTLLVSTEGRNNYESLSDVYKEHIHTAIRVANEQFKHRGKHIDYYTIQNDPTINARHVHFNVILKTTNCDMAKDAAHTHRHDCVSGTTPGNGRPYINCVVCRKDGDKYFTDCIQQWNLLSRQAIRKEQCVVSGYVTGIGTIMLSKSNGNDPQIGCLGCV